MSVTTPILFNNTLTYTYDNTKIQISANAAQLIQVSGGYDTSNPNILENFRMEALSLSAFTEDASYSGSDAIKYTLFINSTDYYWNGSAWVLSDGTYSQANTASEVNAHCADSSLTTLLDGGSYLQIRSFLHSNDGSTTPRLTSVSVTYVFSAIRPGNPTQCTVFCYLTDFSNEVFGSVDDAWFSVQQKDGFNYGQFVIAPSSTSVAFDDNGYAEITLDETQSSGYAVNFSIRYVQDQNVKQLNFAPCIVPNLGAISLTEITIPIPRGTYISHQGTIPSASGSNAFSQVHVPHGTDPQAASPLDTLTLTSSDGSVSISGNASLKTIDLKASSTGSVTSVGLSMPNIFSVSGSPVTGSGTLSVTLNSENQNLVLASPNGSSGVPSFRALVSADLPAGLGSVTSVGLSEGSTNPIYTITNSPVTTSGTLTYTLKNQNINKVFAGPVSGSSDQPSFRSLVSGDIPALSYVTSVGLSLPAIFSVSNSPVTGSGTLTAALANQSANSVFAGPVSGSSSAPTFRSLSSSDIPSLSYVTSVGLSAPGIFSVSNSPVTSSGTLTFSLANQSANTFFSGPTGGSATSPTFRAINSSDISQNLVPISGFAQIAATTILGNNTTGTANVSALSVSQVRSILGISTNPLVLTGGTSFTTASTSTTSTLYRIICVGGGGGAPGVNSTANNTGCGGGSGAVGVLWVSGIAPSTSISYTIGSAGTGGAAGANNGNSGGDTTITIAGVTYTAGGGIRGVNGNTTQGGAGGTTTNFGNTSTSFGIPGQTGFACGSGNATTPSGAGGSTPLGFGMGGASVPPGTINNNGLNGTGYGSGGSGPHVASASGSALKGGDGTQGLILVDAIN